MKHHYLILTRKVWILDYVFTTICLFFKLQYNFPKRILPLFPHSLIHAFAKTSRASVSVSFDCIKNVKSCRTASRLSKRDTPHRLDALVHIKEKPCPCPCAVSSVAFESIEAVGVPRLDTLGTVRHDLSSVMICNLYLNNEKSDEREMWGKNNTFWWMRSSEEDFLCTRRKPSYFNNFYMQRKSLLAQLAVNLFFIDTKKISKSQASSKNKVM